MSISRIHPGQTPPAGSRRSFRRRDTLFASDARRTASVRRSFWLWAVLPAAVCVGLIWYPFGFSLGGMIEEWDFLHVLGSHPGAWNSFPGNPMSAGFAARPFQLTVYFVARAISPHSFIGAHILLICLCVLRVIAGAWIGRYLFRSRSYAAVLGMLFLVFPADTQQISFRTLNVSAASTLMIWGGVLTLMALGARRRAVRAAAIVAAVVLSCCATMIYEGVVALYALAPVLVVVRLGPGSAIDLIRRRRGVALAWGIGPLVNAAYLAYALLMVGSSYQAQLAHAGGGGGGPSAIVHNARYIVTSAAYRVFYEGWVSSWGILAHEAVNRAFFAVAALAIVGMLLLPNGIGGRSRAYLARAAAAGLVLALAGYLPFVVSESHAVITQRTLISAAPGASIVVVSAILFLFGGFRAAGLAVSSFLVLLGLVAQLYQHDRYARFYTGIIRPYMAYVADRVDPGRRVHLVEDASGFGSYLNGMYFSKVVNGPGARLDDFAGRYFLCMQGTPRPSRMFEHCELKDGIWTLRDVEGAELRYPEHDVDRIAVGRDFDTGYRSRGARWRDLGSFSPDASMFASPPKDTYRCAADSDWGYSGFCRGEGWSNGAPFQAGFRHQNYFTALAPSANLLFGLEPVAEDYTFRVQFLMPPRPDLLQRLELRVNGHPIQFEGGRDHIRAGISRGYLLAGLNEIEFSNVTMPDSTSVLVTGVELAPSSRPATIAAGPETPEMPADRWLAASSEQGYAVLGAGFSAAERTGVWTDGETALMRFKLADRTASRSLVLEAMPYLDDHHTQFDVDFVINGEVALRRRFSLPAGPERIAIPIDTSRIAPDGTVSVRLQIDHPGKPPTGDSRDLGLFLRRFRIE